MEEDGSAMGEDVYWTRKAKIWIWTCKQVIMQTIASDECWYYCWSHCALETHDNGSSSGSHTRWTWRSEDQWGC